MTEEDDATFGRRLGRVETDLARQGTRLDDVDRRLGEMGRVQERTAAGVDELLRREAARPQPTSWRTAAATVLTMMGGLGMLATFSWWFTAQSPAVQDLDRRLTRIDDKDIGRMGRAERRLDDMERWRPTVVRH